MDNKHQIPPKCQEVYCSISPHKKCFVNFVPGEKSRGGTLRSGGPPLPCLYSNNSTETEKNDLAAQALLAAAGILSPYHQKQAETLHANVERFILEKGLSRVGFLTLTFPDNVKTPSEAYNRFRSFNSHFLSSTELFGDWISVKERQKRGAWHFHLLIDCLSDIRTGIDFSQLSNRDYSSAPESLRIRWSVLRSELSKYGFGRSELLPICSNAQAMSFYIGKYISKHLSSRSGSDKGVRLVSYSRSWLKNSCKFQWNTDNSKEWRRKLKLFAHMNGCSDLYDLTKKLGSSWAYNHAQTIFEIDDLMSRANADVPF